MATRVCEECYEYLATASEYLTHKEKEHKEGEEEGN
jgi:hypothetical protein